MNPRDTHHTAVQIRAVPRCEIVHGAPHVTVSGQRGPVALFPPGEVVAYAVHVSRPPRLFLFRTEAPAVAGVALPGVYPHVRLLLALQSARVIRRTRRFFTILRRRDLSPSCLTDAFYVRLDRALRARSPLSHLVDALLEVSP